MIFDCRLYFFRYIFLRESSVFFFLCFVSFEITLNFVIFLFSIWWCKLLISQHVILCRKKYVGQSPVIRGFHPWIFKDRVPYSQLFSVHSNGSNISSAYHKQFAWGVVIIESENMHTHIHNLMISACTKYHITNKREQENLVHILFRQIR